MRRSLALCIIAAAAGLGLAPIVARAADPPVTVFAAASLREALQAAAPAFTQRTGFAVRFNFGGSDTLAAQLLQGAPADVFASANVAQMQRVAALVGDTKTLVRNRIVVIVRKDARNIATVPDIAKPNVKVVLASPTVPVGNYARVAFGNLTKNPAFGENFFAAVNANIVSEETDVKAVVTKVALGEADAGVVYSTDVTPSIAPKVRVLQFPGGVAPDAVYPIAPIKAAPNAAGAKAFIDFITSPAGLAYLKAQGFEE
jgi:molybdate transport system substrate-binding protein